MKKIAFKFFSLAIAIFTLSPFGTTDKTHASSPATNALDDSTIPTTIHGCGCSSCNEPTQISTLNN